ncbi:MAG: VWA domain-containing protein [Myxococcaceae bacterium]
MTRTVSGWMGLLGAVALVHCDCGSPVSAQDSTLPESCAQVAPVSAKQKTDILFVIDNSGSMEEEQAAVASELSSFVSALRQGSGLEQDFQFGVITTSAYRHPIGGGFFENDYASQAGRLQAVPLSGERILSGSDPDVVTKFSALVQQGTSGSTQETPFEVVRRALTAPLIDTPPAQDGNQGFLRDGARLLVVVVSDEDDCSEMPPYPSDVRVGVDPNVSTCTQGAAQLTPVSEYANVFRNLVDGNGAAREVLWAAIAPVAVSDKRAEEVVISGRVQNADCITSLQGGYRHRAMAALFDPELENLDSICSASYRDSLLRIAILATLGQSVEIMSAPDPRLLRVAIERGGGSVDLCTLTNGGIRYEPKFGGRPARIQFQNQCARRAADVNVTIDLICAG